MFSFELSQIVTAKKYLFNKKFDIKNQKSVMNLFQSF
jgi:hypothetical protein